MINIIHIMNWIYSFIFGIVCCFSFFTCLCCSFIISSWYTNCTCHCNCCCWTKCICNCNWCTAHVVISTINFLYTTSLLFQLHPFINTHDIGSHAFGSTTIVVKSTPSVMIRVRKVRSVTRARRERNQNLNVKEISSPQRLERLVESPRSVVLVVERSPLFL